MIGANIKKKRVQQGMTQERLAELIGCSQSNVSKYENEELGIDAMMLPEIARVLSCTIDDLYSDRKGA